MYQDSLQTLASSNCNVNAPFGSDHVNQSINCGTLRGCCRQSGDTLGRSKALSQLQRAIGSTVDPRGAQSRFQQLLGTRGVSAVFHVGPINEVCNIAFVSRGSNVITHESMLKGRFSTGIFGRLCPTPGGSGRIPRRRATPWRRVRGRVTGPVSNVISALLSLASARTCRRRRQRVRQFQGEE